MPSFDVHFLTPGGKRSATLDGDPASIKAQIEAEGFLPLWFAPAGTQAQQQAGGAAPVAQAAPQAPPQPGTAGGAVAGRRLQGAPSPADSQANILSTIGQVGLPLAATALAPETGGGSLAALGLLGGLGGAALGRRGLPTLGDVGSTVAGEVLPPAVRTAARSLKLPNIARMIPGAARGAENALSRGVSGTAEKAGIPLAAGQRFPQAVGKGLVQAGTEVPESLVARQEAAAGQAIVNESRAALKAIPENPVKSAHQLLTGLKGFANGLDEVEGAAFKRSLTDIDPKLNLDKLSVGGLRTMVAKNPLAVKEMFRIAQAAGRGVAEAPETTTARLWLTDAIHGSTKVPLGVGQFRSGRAMFDLDGRAFKDIWRSLKPADQAAFGPVAKNLEHLVRVIDTFPAADRSRIAMPWFKTALHKNPLLPLALGAFGAEELGAGRMMHGFAEHPFVTGGVAATTALLLGSAKGSKYLMSRFLASDAGSRWVAAGLAAQARGVPEMLIVEGLTRMAGRNMQPGGGGPSQTPARMPGLPALGPASALAQ